MSPQPAKKKANLPATVDRAAPLGSQLSAVLAGQGVIGEEDPQIVAQRIAQQLLGAKSLEELFANNETTNTTDLIGRRLRVRDVILRKSDLENTEVYALVDAINLDTGEVIVMNTSSPRVMAQLCRAKDLAALPLDVQVIEVGQAKVGQNAPTGLILVK